MENFHLPQTVGDFSSLVKILEENKPDLIAIDGDTGLGKSTLAKEIITKFRNYSLVSLDKFIRYKNKGYYNISLKKIKNNLASLKNRKIIFEGLMVLKYLKKLKINLKECFLIYIKDRGLDEIWEWENEYGKYYKKDIKKIIMEEEKNLTLINNAVSKDQKYCHLKGLDKQLLIYKYKFRPWEKANIIFLSD